jgi:SAM-dependent methyltransferase
VADAKKCSEFTYRQQQKRKPQNIDQDTIDDFGHEWAAFDQTGLPQHEQKSLFDQYFAIFPFEDLPANAEGFDLGCGSGRWASLFAPKVGHLHCIDPAEKALSVAKVTLASQPNVSLHLANSDTIPLQDASQDFAYSLGVLHHIPDTEAALRDCVSKLKIGAPILIYLYYALDNKPYWFRVLWTVTDKFRRGIAFLPFKLKKALTTGVAICIYWPLARLSNIAELFGLSVSNIPLSSYRRLSFYTMRTDALDRFGTRLEQRFTKSEIQSMMERCGLERIVFHDDVPFWIACGRKVNT